MNSPALLTSNVQSFSRNAQSMLPADFHARPATHPQELRIELHMSNPWQHAQLAAQTNSDQASTVRLSHLIRAAHRGFYQGLQARLADRGIMMGHWSYLRLLWEHGTQTQRELSRRANFRDPTTLEALRAMEKLGLITRRRNEENRREVHVSLTKKGHDLKEPLLALAMDMNEIAVRRLEEGTIQSLWDALNTMIENFEMDEAERGAKKLAEKRNPKNKPTRGKQAQLKTGSPRVKSDR